MLDGVSVFCGMVEFAVSVYLDYCFISLSFSLYF